MKTSRARVTDYLVVGVLKELEKIGFYVVGYGCNTPYRQLRPAADRSPRRHRRRSCGHLGAVRNRNFEREVKMNFLASPPLVVAYAIAGTTDIDLTTQPLGTGSDGQPVFLRDIWPSNKGNRRCHRRDHRPGDVQAELRRRVQG